MQATVVLLIHLAVGPVPARSEQAPEDGHGPAQSFDPLEAVFTNCKKALHWLNHMANFELPCKRSFEICHHLLHRITKPKGLNLEGVPSPSSLKRDPNQHLLPVEQSTSVSEDPDNVGDKFSSATRISTIEGEPSEISPWSLVAGSNMGWFISMEEMEQIYAPNDGPPGRT